MVSDQIRKAIGGNVRPGENEEDVAKMIELLADARAQARGGRPNAADENYAATILCVVFDPVKTQAHRTFVYGLRDQYHGIAQDDGLQKLFLDSMNPHLLSDATPVESIQRGAHELFQLPSGSARGP